jgi:YidC/Oxa1 family membrane protein insertase
MERRVLLAIFLSFLVLYVYQTLVVKPVPKPAGVTSPSTTPTPGAAAAAPPPAPKPPVAPPSGPTATALVGDTGDRDVRVETRDVIALVTNRGARLKSWRLKHFLDQKREPLELVATELAATQPLPFSLAVDDAAVTATMNGALYTVSGAPSGGAATASPTDLRFEYRDSAGLHVVKEFHFEPASYVVTVRATVTQEDRPSSPAIQWGPAVGDVASEVSRFTVKAEALLSANGNVQRLSQKDIAKQSTYQGDFSYAGVDDQYFMTAALSLRQAKVTFQTIAIPPPEGSKDQPRELVAYAVAPGQPETPITFFAGPKDFDVLKSLDPELVRAINFGWFAFLVVPLLRSLKWINGYVGNYGWSIIFLTIIINAIMFPLRHKSVVSMRKMQEIQPEVKAIQDRYAKLKATDPAKQKMNQELMALYKERGVNPASGCVPMLLTMPVLFAFYSLLSTAIELRGAPFVGWIHDLSLHDPLYITPVLMGLSQLWQQRITPAAGADPAQRTTMMLMPVVFTFMFLWAPSGVALYWLISNLWGIGQQYLTNYLIGPPTVRPPARPPAQRQMKRVGGGKTDAAGARELKAEG